MVSLEPANRKGPAIRHAKPMTPKKTYKKGRVTSPSPIQKPPDWLRGSMKKGGKYTAWNTFGQGKPDFGKGKGPGDPYHESPGVVGMGKAHRPPIVSNKKTYQPADDARVNAIQRRLRGL